MWFSWYAHKGCIDTLIYRTAIQCQVHFLNEEEITSGLLI